MVWGDEEILDVPKKITGGLHLCSSKPNKTDSKKESLLGLDKLADQHRRDQDTRIHWGKRRFSWGRKRRRVGDNVEGVDRKGEEEPVGRPNRGRRDESSGTGWNGNKPCDRRNYANERARVWRYGGRAGETRRGLERTDIRGGKKYPDMRLWRKREQGSRAGRDDYSRREDCRWGHRERNTQSSFEKEGSGEGERVKRQSRARSETEKRQSPRDGYRRALDGGRRQGGNAKVDSDVLAYEEEQARLDREWYLGDTEARTMGGENGWKTIDEDEVAEKQAKRLTEKAAAHHRDASRWENRQLQHGGVEVTGGVDRDALDEDAGPRVGLLVKNIVPPFLDGRVVHSELEHIILPVKDPTSDMATIARRGSALVKAQRLGRERGKARVKYWELGGTAGAKAKEDKEAMEAKQLKSAKGAHTIQEDDIDYKASMQYSTELKKTTTPTSQFAKNKSIGEQRKSLPVFSVRDELLMSIRENPVVVIVGETGSGKTTQLTQYLYEEGFAEYGTIGCTQPRRVAAVTVAKRVSEEMGCELGKEVGYSIRFEDETCSETKIKYMTDGILLRESLLDPDLEKYSCIIMDEAHERSLNTDVLFGILRRVLERRRDLKVIITSATMNAGKFAAFFGSCPILNIPGRTFPVDIFFSKTPVEDYVEGAVWQIMQIHLQAPLPGDILVFMSGQEDIETTCEILAEKLEKLDNPPPLLILPIYSQLAADSQAKIFQPAPAGTRKVVVATNIAETSLTIDGILYVIDSGFCKLKTYNPRVGMDALLLCPVSRASADQRSGRAGRTGPGKCYRLFTAGAYANEMLQTNVPEIQRTNLGHVVLLLKSLGIVELINFPFLDPPPAENINKSMLGLWLLGALDGGGGLTHLGHRMSAFPLDPTLSAFLFAAERFGCTTEAVTIVAMLSVPNVFFRPHGREEESDAAREKFYVPESDHLTLLHVYQRWRASGSGPQWCTKHFINWKAMKKAREVRAQLADIMKTEKMEMSTCGHEWDAVRHAIASAYFYQAARMKGIGEYVNLKSGLACSLHPTSALYGLGFTPDYVVYHELIYVQKEYMSCVTAVEPEWLASEGPLLYSLKKTGETHTDCRRRELEESKILEREMAAGIAAREKDHRTNLSVFEAAAVRKRRRAASPNFLGTSKRLKANRLRPKAIANKQWT